jgi:hypothetical protein
LYLACHWETSGNTNVLPAPLRLPPVDPAAAKLAPNARATTANAAAVAVFLNTLSLLLLDDVFRIEYAPVPMG